MSPKLGVLAALWCASAAATVHRVHVERREDVLDQYEKIAAKVSFRIDPKLPANRIISDIDLAPRNEQGEVEFMADLYVLKPRDSAQGNGTVLFEVSNRGGRGLHGMFSRGGRGGDDYGDAFLLEQGFTLVWLGWQPDVPRDPGLLRLYAPVARGGEKAVTGLVRSEYVPSERVQSFSLGDRTMSAYPMADPGDPSLQLTVRDRAEGPRRTIPRSEWRFEPDLKHVFVTQGLEPGKIYELVYRAKDPVLVGLGPAGVRDFISFLKYGTPGSDITLLGDQRRHMKRAIGFGISQSGRFLRTFLYYGFNQDEKNRRVFDGVWAHVAGAGRGSFNHRFAQPSRDGHPFMNIFYPTDIFPFTDLEQTDAETGMTDSILARAEKAGVVPKIFYTNSSYEYWGRAASLIHTTIDGRADAPLAKDTRVYFFAGSQHGPSGFPPGRTDTQNLVNPNDFRWSMRALLAAFQKWLADGVEPPPSQYPKISDGTLVSLKKLAISHPSRPKYAYRVDYGPQFRTSGIVSIEPPKVGSAFPILVPQVDVDGNETSGVRMPELAAPLATYTGWNLRDPKIGAPDEMYSMAGSWIPFPRASIEKRYGSKDGYLKKVASDARGLVERGFLLQRDVPAILDRSAAEWDFIMKP